MNSSFVENRAGIEGAAVMSIGLFEIISNVSFLENTYYCRPGEYGYTVKSEVRQIGASGARKVQ